MKFVVDELPYFSHLCPFNKEEWSEEGWINICTLSDDKCNLYESKITTECYGLKEVQWEQLKLMRL